MQEYSSRSLQLIRSDSIIQVTAITRTEGFTDWSNTSIQIKSCSEAKHFIIIAKCHGLEIIGNTMVYSFNT